MKHRPHTGGFFAQNAKRIVGRLARVNHDRQAAGPRQRDLTPEHQLLYVARREVVVVVQSDLSDGDAAMRVDGSLDEGDACIQIAGNGAPPGEGGCQRQT